MWNFEGNVADKFRTVEFCMERTVRCGTDTWGWKKNWKGSKKLETNMFNSVGRSSQSRDEQELWVHTQQGKQVLLFAQL